MAKKLTKQASVATRRMGPPGSENWHSMLDGAEDILRDEGYAAVTSRSIAERIGVKQRLIYYYFQTMDDLIVETFKRLAVRELERLGHALTLLQPLRQIWNVCLHTNDARLITEFMALANRNKALRKEVITFIEASRAIQVEALSTAIKRRDANSIAPVGIAMLATSVALSLTREKDLGINAGHNDVLTAIESFLSEVEPDAGQKTRPRAKTK